MLLMQIKHGLPEIKRGTKEINRELKLLKEKYYNKQKYLRE
jgi:hypothetical protein